jgi:hypothetical protein
MSSLLDVDVINQEEEELPTTLESYAALVKQLVSVINMVLRDFH